MDIDFALRRLGVSARKAVNKARELQRLSAVKLCNGLSDAGDLCVPFICVELACHETGTQLAVTRPEILKLAGAPARAYQSALASVQHALGLQATAYSIKELAVRFGGQRIAERAQQLLATYQRSKLRALGDHRSQHADFSSPAFAAAAYALCCRHEKIPVNKRELLQLTGVADQQFNFVCGDMQELCADEVTGRVRGRSGKRKAASASAADEGAAPARGAASARAQRLLTAAKSAPRDSSSKKQRTGVAGTPAAAPAVARTVSPAATARSKEAEKANYLAWKAAVLAKRRAASRSVSESQPLPESQSSQPLSQSLSQSSESESLSESQPLSQSLSQSSESQSLSESQPLSESQSLSASQSSQPLSQSCELSQASDSAEAAEESQPVEEFTAAPMEA